MSEPQEESRAQRLALARQLLEQLEAEQDEEASVTIMRLGAPYERQLFDELGRLTRDLHEALKSFRDDSRLLEITQADFPDAKERLNHVITMTEQATHRTLNAVDSALPITDALQDRSAHFAEVWEQFRERKLNVVQFRQLATELDEFLHHTTEETRRLGKLMSEIMMAQDFQDLTGQIISRVIKLVQEVEENLVGLVRLSGERLEPGKIPAPTAKASSAPDRGAPRPIAPPQGPPVPNTKDTEADIVSGQDDVDDLLSSLGF